MGKQVIRKEEALEYHELGRPGKIEVIPTKDTKTQRDLALAYSPGVAEPCREIAKNPDDVYRYTAKGNLVAVISNGTAVLGLGNIGPEASKPVMEGKGILFKIFAGIDVFDLELNATDVDDFVRVVKALEPTFGGINLEDIKAPDCFEIETRLKKEMKIPVMHDDQHGTAIITGAALLNSLEVVHKKIEDVRIVVSGAGASAISCVKIFIELGVRRSHVIMCDSKGVIRADRADLNITKKEFATHEDLHTLEDAMKGADIFLGLSTSGVVTPDMLLSMAERPIVFALANPDPEIDYELAMATRPDVIMATGRSDFPNQVNNVLGFPFIFRGALDVRATEINEEMKLAAVKAIAMLAKTPVPDIVLRAYNQANMKFGPQYILPKPLDPRLLTTVAPAVARAAMETGVARFPIQNWDAYKESLIKRMGTDDNVIRVLISKARQNPKRVVFAEADDLRILKAAQIAREEGIAQPIFLGNKEKIRRMIKENSLELDDVPVMDTHADDTEELRNRYGQVFFEKRKRRGYNPYEAMGQMRSRPYFGAMMVELGDADALISGITRKYADTIRPALEIIGTCEKGQKVASMYLMLTRKGPMFFADTTMIKHPTSEELVEIALLAARAVRDDFNIEPKVAMLSYSNFGSMDDPDTLRVRRAVEILNTRHPEIIVDGEIQANFAINTEALRENFPFSPLVETGANVLIFPNLSSANIAYKLLMEMEKIEAIGPIMLGLKKSVHILQMGCSVREIVNMVAIAAVDAHRKQLAALQAEIG